MTTCRGKLDDYIVRLRDDLFSNKLIDVVAEIANNHCYVHMPEGDLDFPTEQLDTQPVLKGTPAIHWDC